VIVTAVLSGYMLVPLSVYNYLIAKLKTPVDTEMAQRDYLGKSSK
jgi:hypothetical protein